MKHFSFLVVVLFTGLVLFSCKKDDSTSPTTNATPPVLTTTAISGITITTAVSGGNISNDGGSSVTSRGVCWSTTSNPVVTGNHSTDGTGTGAFNSAITGLTANTTYYLRAYAINSIGTAYGNEVSFTTSLPSPSIYILGYDSNASKIWKNGVGTALTNGFCSERAGSIFVSGTDVYVAGYDYNGTHYIAKVWKNGVATALTNGVKDAVATSVFVSGTDVYVAGYEAGTVTPTGNINIAKVWKNGVAISLTDGTSDARAESIFVSGNDVYVAGTLVNTTTGSGFYPTIWKNGIAAVLGSIGEAFSVFVSGTDVYVAGYDRTGGSGASNIAVAKIWKNGVAITLTNGPTDSYANSVFVVGTDVYVAGWEDDINHKSDAKIWKNGVATTLANGVYNSGVNSIFVSGTDVYVAGWESTGTKLVAKIWKNGVVTSLTDGTSTGEAFSIIVK